MARSKRGIYRLCSSWRKRLANASPLPPSQCQTTWWKRKRWLSCSRCQNTRNNFAKILSVFLIMRSPLCYRVLPHPSGVSCDFFADLLDTQTLAGFPPLLRLLQTSPRTGCDIASHHQGALSVVWGKLNWESQTFKVQGSKPVNCCLVLSALWVPVLASVIANNWKQSISSRTDK